MPILRKEARAAETSFAESMDFLKPAKADGYGRQGASFAQLSISPQWRGCRAGARRKQT